MVQELWKVQTHCAPPPRPASLDAWRGVSGTVPRTRVNDTTTLHSTSSNLQQAGPDRGGPATREHPRPIQKTRPWVRQTQSQDPNRLFPVLLAQGLPRPPPH